MYYLGLDYGGTQIKSALYSNIGEELAVFALPTSAQTPAPQIVEIDMQALWQSACICIGKLLQSVQQSHGITGNDLRGIAISSHGKGLYLLDANGMPCGKGILSSDTRALSLVQSWRGGLNREIYPFILQDIWPAHPLALLCSLAEQEPERLERSRYICMGHDYLRYCLTGEIAAERSNISGSGLVDVQRNEYSLEVLAATALQGVENKLPPIIDPAQICGHVNKKAAQATGLPESLSVYGGFFDVVGAAVASGLRSETDYHAIMGTWSISTCLASSVADTKALGIPWGSYAALPGMFFVHDGSPSSASNLNWFLRQFTVSSDFRYNDQILAKIRPGDNGLFFYPYLYASNLGAATPGSLQGLQGHHSYEDVLYAVYEGILLAHKVHLDKLEVVQPTPQRIFLTGGPSQSQVWMQMFADLMGLPLWRLEKTRESGCKGAAMAAAVGSGQFRNFQEAMDAWVCYQSPIEPKARNAQAWHDKYQKYLALGKHLAEFFNN